VELGPSNCQRQLQLEKLVGQIAVEALRPTPGSASSGKNIGVLPPGEPGPRHAGQGSQNWPDVRRSAATPAAGPPAVRKRCPLVREEGRDLSGVGGRPVSQT